jgi:osmoprotectant transport system substrate-binding protein
MFAWVGLLAAPGLALSGCDTSGEPRTDASALHDDAITVGSFDFAESELVAELYSQALERADVEVHRAFGIGPRELVAPALAQGLIELVPEYAGTALQFHSLGADKATADVAATHDALVEALRGSNLTALAAAPAQDANTFVVTRTEAARGRLRRLSDLAGVAQRLTFGGPPECPGRPLCLAGLEEVYGLTFQDVVRLDAGGPVTRQALQDGAVDVALLFSTDPAIDDGNLVELDDDRGLQPAENVTPLVRTEALDRFGSIVADALNAVSRHLTTDGLRGLNAQVAAGDVGIAAVASAWLDAEGIS